MKPRLLIDARCLQHPGAARRGIGLHLIAMLEARQAADFAITLLFDPLLPPPTPSHAAFGEAATMTGYAASRTDTLLLQPAPMSFLPAPLGRLLASPGIRSLAIVLDFIPYDMADLYLTDPATRRLYAKSFVALRRYDWFLPISRATEMRLHALFPASVGHSDITGVAMRPSLLRGHRPYDPASRAGVLVVAGDDKRKNPEIAVRAGLPGPIRYIGIHDPTMRSRLAALHAEAGGEAGALEFLPHLDDAELAEHYARARILIAPSRSEGFSMPVIEAMAQGTPVLAADEAAQAELVTNPEDRFAPDDTARLRVLGRNLLQDDAAWRAVQTRQDGVWRNFTADAVAARFWTPIERMAVQPVPSIRRGARPQIAFLSPLPPALTGCADYSASLLDALVGQADITAYSDTKAPVLPQGIRFGGTADPTVMRNARYDAIVTVLGNSEFHRTEMRLLLDYGAAAILHDARMLGFYRAMLGEGRARGVASGELARNISSAEITEWERDQATMPIRCLGEIAASAAPLIVHAVETARFIADRHGVAANHIPFAPYRLPDPASLTSESRCAARARLGIGDHESLIVSFGNISRDKDPERLLAAAAGLDRPSRLILAGATSSALATELRACWAELGQSDASLVMGTAPIPESAYRDYLSSADIAVQLRRAPPGSISGALMDAIAAGVPAVAGATLTEAINPPDYIHKIADDADIVALTTVIGVVLAQGRAGIEPRRQEFLAARGMNRYACALLQAILA